MVEKLGFLSFAPSSVRNFLNLISNEESGILCAARGLASQNGELFEGMLLGRSDLQAFLEPLKLIERYVRAFSIKITARGRHQ